MPLCTYCGAFDGSARDHVIPASYTSIVKHFSVGHTVPACNECNSTLSDLMHVTVPDRAAHLLKVYKRRYNKLLQMPNWDHDELSEMSTNFQLQIAARIAVRNTIKDRLAKLHLVKSGFDIYTVDLFSEESLLMSKSNLAGSVAVKKWVKPKKVIDAKFRAVVNKTLGTIKIITDAGEFYSYNEAARFYNTSAYLIKSRCLIESVK